MCLRVSLCYSENEAQETSKTTDPYTTLDPRFECSDDVRTRRQRSPLTASGRLSLWRVRPSLSPNARAIAEEIGWRTGRLWRRGSTETPGSAGYGKREDVGPSAWRCRPRKAPPANLLLLLRLEFVPDIRRGFEESCGLRFRRGRAEGVLEPLSDRCRRSGASDRDDVYPGASIPSEARTSAIRRSFHNLDSRSS